MLNNFCKYYCIEFAVGVRKIIIFHIEMLVIKNL